MVSVKCIGFVLLVLNLGLSEALFEGCDHKYYLNPNSVAYLLNPLNPNKYPSGTSCRYELIAPLDYEILAECVINIDKNPSSCSTEYFYLSRDGDKSLSGAERTCGSGSLTRTTLFRRLVIAYTSGAAANSGIGGVFNCTLTVRPQACDCGWTINTRIVGGEETAIGEFPSTVALVHTPSNQLFCGGSIIGHRAILTAAHCLELYSNANEISVLVGDHDLASSTESPYAATYTVAGYYINSGYNSTNNKDDIAILITNTDIEWSRGVGPICLPFDQASNPFEYVDVFLVGWGSTSLAGPRSDKQQKASVSILPNSVCSSVYPDLLASQECTYYPDRDSCQLDSGGPVARKGAVRQFLLGLISFGFNCGSQPGVNTRITSYLDWIQFYGGTLCSKPYN